MLCGDIATPLVAARCIEVRMKSAAAAHVGRTNSSSRSVRRSWRRSATGLNRMQTPPAPTSWVSP